MAFAPFGFGRIYATREIKISRHRIDPRVYPNIRFIRGREASIVSYDIHVEPISSPSLAQATNVALSLDMCHDPTTEKHFALESFAFSSFGKANT